MVHRSAFHNFLHVFGRYWILHLLIPFPRRRTITDPRSFLKIVWDFGNCTLCLVLVYFKGCKVMVFVLEHFCKYLYIYTICLHLQRTLTENYRQADKHNNTYRHRQTNTYAFVDAHTCTWTSVLTHELIYAVIQCLDIY